MGRSFYRNHLSSAAQRKSAASVSAVQDNSSSEKKEAAAPVVVYGDLTVCRYLGIRRRKLAEARTAKSRGEDWDCCGLHAGMTKAWIDRYALENHIVPKFDVPLEPIKEGDGIVSVVLIGTHPNPCRCTVEVLATGEHRFATVRNLYQYPIHLREAFDCVQVPDNLEWYAKPNEVAY